MNRVQKKCLIVSSALHALLIGVVLFGSALHAQEQGRVVQADPVVFDQGRDRRPHDRRESKCPECAASSARTGTAQTGPDRNSQTAGDSQAKSTTEEKPEPVKPQKYRLDPVGTEADEARRTQAAQNSSSNGRQAAREAAENRSRLVKQIGNNIRSLSSELSPTTTVELRRGIGRQRSGGGELPGHCGEQVHGGMESTGQPGR